MPFNEKMYSDVKQWLLEHSESFTKEMQRDLLHFEALSEEEKAILYAKLLEIPELPIILKRFMSSHFGRLPHELHQVIAEFLSKPEKKALSDTNVQMYSMFTDVYPKFLECVAYGKQDEVEDLLARVLQAKEENIQKCLLHRGRFTDYSGRTFYCSAYEYAYWAKDTYMCRMLERYMDQATKAKISLLIDSMEQEGLTYEQDGVKNRCPHFDFSVLKEALLSMYELSIETEKLISIDEVSPDLMARAETTFRALSLAQKDMPVHVVQEYCRPERTFYPCPSFDEQPLRGITYYNTRIAKHVPWFPYQHSETIESIWILFRGESKEAINIAIPIETIKHDLEAITHLDEVRTAELKLSRENLNRPPASLEKQ